MTSVRTALLYPTLNLNQIGLLTRTSSPSSCDEMTDDLEATRPKKSFEICQPNIIKIELKVPLKDNLQSELVSPF